VQPMKSDGSTSWAMFQWQFETVTEHDDCQPCKKATYQTAALNEPATHILHSVPSGARLVQCLRNAMVTTTWKQQSMLI
jgi:hypothetical protein